MESSVIELQPIVEAWAHNMFENIRRSQKDMSKIPLKALLYSVNWKHVHVQWEEPVYNDVHRAHMPTSQVLFKTTFANDTELEQEYSFKTQRTTKSCCEVRIEKGISTGVELGFKLATPFNVVEANAGFHREITVTQSETETIEHEMSWEVDSQIRVPAQHKTEAHLVVNEDNQSSKFTVTGRMKGTVIVTVTNRQANNAFVTSLEGDLAEIFRNEMKHYTLEGLVVRDKTVHFYTVGKCSFRYGVEQHVKLYQSRIH